jgi:hypothetical protein
MCHVDVNLEEVLEEFKRKKRAGKLTDEDVIRGVGKRKPKNKSELISFLDAIGLGEAARDRITRKVVKSGKRAGRQFLHDLVDDLMPEEDEVVIEADYEVECPECGKMVKNLRTHRCDKK